MIQANSARRVLLVALALGWSVDLLFYAKPFGISVLIFVLLLINAVFGLSRMEDVQPSLRNLWLVLPLLFFAGMVFVRANLFLTALNIMATALLLGLLAYFYTEGRVEKLGFFGYLFVPLISMLTTLSAAAPVVPAGVDFKAINERGIRRALPLMRGLLLAVPVLAVFAILLSSADRIFADYVDGVLRFEALTDLPELAWRGVIILCAAWVVAGLLVYTLRRRQISNAIAAVSSPPGSLVPARLLGAVEAATVLASVNVLFIVFVWFQYEYLFSGRAALVMDGLEYRAYARRGFAELVMVSVLTIGLILTLRWLARHDTPKQQRIFNAFSTLMIGLTLVMLASAWLRMVNWEAVADYVYTEKRLYVRVFLVWLALLFVWLATNLWFQRTRFALGAFVAALGFLATLNVMNPDEDIVRYNVERSRTTGELYTPYLAQLSDDAVPALVWALDQAPAKARDALRYDLSVRLIHMEADTSWRSWPAFHLARAQAHVLLAKETVAQR